MPKSSVHSSNRVFCLEFKIKLNKIETIVKKNSNEYQPNTHTHTNINYIAVAADVNVNVDVVRGLHMRKYYNL